MPQGRQVIYVEYEVSIEKCLDLTANLLIASLQSGQLKVFDGQALAKCFDEVFGQVCDCAQLTSQAFIEKFSKQKLARNT